MKTIYSIGTRAAWWSGVIYGFFASSIFFGIALAIVISR